MKRVCFLTNNINQIGGIERLISMFSLTFAEEEEYSLTILSLYSGPEERSYFELSDKTVLIHGNCRSRKKQEQYLTDFFTKYKFDDLVTFHPTISFLISKIIRKIKPIKWIITEHCDPMSYTWKRRLLNLYVYSKADCLVTLTDRSAKYYRKRLIFRTVVIPNPVSFICNEVSHKTSNIISVGRIEAVKRFDLLVEAFGSIEKKYPDWKLRIVGGGSLYQQLQEKSHLYKQIELLGPQKNIKELMLDASFFVISSEYEGFSLVAIEALECGLPIISTDLPSIRWITKGYNCCILSEQGNSKELAERIEQLILDPVLVQKMSLEAKKCAEQFHMDRIIQYWKEVL